ncbi:7891_t:CDS:2, partial [Scutellospora calospora]
IASSEVGRGVLYVDIPSRFDDFGKEFGKALNFAFEKRISFTQQLILIEPLWWRALEAFKRGAKAYKAKFIKPAFIIYDNTMPKKNADDNIYIAVFISSEGVVPRRMESRSAWSRAKLTIEIGDLSKEESMKYLTEKLKITEEAEKLYELVGGRILELKGVTDQLSSGIH